MVARAGVSQSAFHQVFQSAEECLLATFEDGLARLSETVEAAAGRELRWLDRLRAGLVALLGYLDDEPGWGRLLLFHAPGEGAVAFRCEQRVLGLLTVLLDDGSPQAIAELACEPQLTGELVVGGVFSALRTRMLEASGDPLVQLAPSLMSFIVKLYRGQAAASAELVGRSPDAQEARAWQAGSPPPSAAPPPVPVTRRTALVLKAIACAPRSSNREIAAAAGLCDEGQTSHLLRRLAQRGLIEKVRPRSGSRRENAWLLTAPGRRVVELLGLASAPDPRPTATAGVREAA